MAKRFLTALIITTIITGGYFYYLKSNGLQEAEEANAAKLENSLETASGGDSQTATAVNAENTGAEPSGNVEFTLTDQNGKPVTDKDLKGKKLLTYFGFTRCPDICPVSMAVISEVMNQLETQKITGVQPVFISIDPAHDTPAALKTYLKDYNPHFIALTGPESEIDKVKQSYRVYVEIPAGSTDEHNENNDHANPPARAELPGHSNLIYYMDENGKYLTHFTSDNAPEDIVDYISNH